MELAGVDTRMLYLALLGLVAAERVVELFITRRNLRRVLARGGRLIRRGDPFGPMVVLHTALLIVPPLEVWALDRPFLPTLGAAMGALLVGSMALRYWAIVSLGDRWTTRVVVVPEERLVRHGPYRHLRHPNYLAVVVEVAALPLFHTAWWSAVVFSAANAWVLARRIAIEVAALGESSDGRGDGLARPPPTTPS